MDLGTSVSKKSTLWPF